MVLDAVVGGNLEDAHVSALRLLGPDVMQAGNRAWASFMSVRGDRHMLLRSSSREKMLDTDRLYRYRKLWLNACVTW